ncbi:MAG: hypothetical protein H7Z37_15905 [Pyrinomonadaceae bacterium]|nr:hypothetical protein [Pyrinomonadaceae bacterium]
MIIGFAFTQTTVSAQTQETLTNETIVQMWNAKLSAEAIMLKIKTSPANFDVSAIALQELKKVNVADSVILAMVQKTTGVEMSAPPPPPSVSTTAVSTQPTKMILLEDKTPVKLRLNRNLSSGDAKIGDTVDFEVIEDVKVGEIVVIQRGAIAIATVTNAKARGRMGKGGKLDVVLDSVRLVSGDKAILRASKETQGGSNTGKMTGAIVASSILFFPAAPFFLFMKGKDITIPKGTEITGYVNGNTSLDAAKFNLAIAK